jgi:hypothetical protein
MADMDADAKVPEAAASKTPLAGTKRTRAVAAAKVRDHGEQLLMNNELSGLICLYWFPYAGRRRFSASS